MFLDYNFSHRIDHFSFGDRHSGIVNPLDGEEQITKNSKLKLTFSTPHTHTRVLTHFLLLYEPRCENTGICENKDADQLRGNREADQRLCFCYMDSTIPLLPKSEISSL